MSIFIDYPGITGDVSDENHKGFIVADSIGWGVSRRINSRSGTWGDRESANAEIGGVLVTRRMDKATPKIFIESCCGTGKDVTISLTKTGSGVGADIFMQYTLRNALISQYQVEIDASESKRPMEKLIISFVGIEMKYTAFDEDGRAIQSQAMAFDTSTNSSR